MTARELNEALCALWPELIETKGSTVDKIIAGDPQQEVGSVAVCWMPYSETLREAAARGANTVVAHEPTFYDHWELRQEPGNDRLMEAKRAKEALIAELGLTVMRCHDVWDAVEGVGVPFEWGRFLGFGEPVSRVRYQQVFEVKPGRAEDWARWIAGKTSQAGQGTVEFYGDPDRAVTRIGIGTGCCSEAMDLYGLGADLAVTVDDIARCWVIGEYCRDTGQPLVVVNHGVSEACAMGALAAKVQEITGGEAFEIKQGASYREIRAE